MRRSSLLFNDNNTATPAFARFLDEAQIPGHDLLSIDAALQERFFQKNPDGTAKERWDLGQVEVSCPPLRIKEHLAGLGFMNETKPNLRFYNYAAWPGALVVRAVVRLNDLLAAWKSGIRWEKVVVFGGKRPLQADKESYEECCKAAGLSPSHADARNIWDSFSPREEKRGPQTEMQMMQWLWHVARIPSEASRNRFVDAPMKPPIKPGGPPVRPNTEDTIITWLEEAKPQPGFILLSSGAPYGMAMDEAFNMLLEPKGFTVETFGHATPETLGIELLMREVAGAINRIRRSRSQTA